MSDTFRQPQWVHQLTNLFARFLPTGFEMLDDAVERHGSWEWTAADLRQSADDPTLLVTTATPTRPSLSGGEERGVTLAAWHMSATSAAGAPSDSSIRWIWLSERRLRDPVLADILQTFLRFSTAARTPGAAVSGAAAGRGAHKPPAVTVEVLVRLLNEQIQFELPAGAVIDESTALVDLDLDSLDFAELLFVLEHELDVSLDYEQAFEVETFGDLVTLVNKLRNERGATDKGASREF